MLETLVYSGALDEFNLTKKTMIESYQKVIDFYRFNPSGYFTDKINLGDNLGEYPTSVLMEKEFLALGFYLNTHPVQKYKAKYQNIITPSDTLKYLNKEIELVAYIESIRKMQTKKNEEMAMVLLSDDTTSIYGVVFPRVYRLIMNRLENKTLVKVRCLAG